MPYVIFNGLRRPVAPAIGATSKGRSLILRIPGGDGNKFHALRPGSSVRVSDEVYDLNKELLASLHAQGARATKFKDAPVKAAPEEKVPEVDASEEEAVVQVTPAEEGLPEEDLEDEKPIAPPPPAPEPKAAPKKGGWKSKT